MKRFPSLVLALALLIAPVAQGARAQSINPQIGGGIGFGFDGGISHTAGNLTGGFSFAGGYPLDSVAATYLSAGSVAALTSSWKTGNLFDLVSPAVTIKAVGPGYPDVRSLAAALGVDPVTGIGGGLISKLYDQSGNGKDWTQATTGAIRPMVYLIQGKVYLGFGGFLSSNNALAQPFLTSAASINNRSFSVFVPIIPYTSTNSPAPGTYLYSTVFGTRAGAPGVTDVALLGPSSTTAVVQTPKIYSGAGDYTTGIQQLLAPYIGIQGHILSLVSSASSATVQANTTSAAGTALVANAASTPLSFGESADGATPLSGRSTAIIVSSSIFTGPQITTLTTALGAWSNINTTVNKANAVNVVVDGASPDIGQGSTPGGGYQTLNGGGYGYTEMLKDYFAANGKQISWHNLAVPGATLINRTADYTSNFAQLSAFQAGSTKNILIGPGISGVASILGGKTGAQAYTDYLAYLAAVKSVGWTRIASIAHPDNGNAEVLAYNNLVVANAVANGVDILDMRSFTGLFIPPLANADGHPTILGSQAYFSVIQPYLQQFNFLMRRDIGGPANDNRPVGIDVAA